MKFLPVIAVTSIVVLFAETLPIPKWIDPSLKACESNGGSINDGYCDASFYNAQKICEADGYILPTIETFKATSERCSAKAYDEYSNTFTPLQATEIRRKNRNNDAYRNCVEELGFDRLFLYVSATKKPDWDWQKLKRDVVLHDFSSAYSITLAYTDKAHVRCIE